MKKQTAVELLEQQLKERFSLINSEPLFEQAKQKEKEQMWDYITKKYCIGDKSLEFHKLEFEQYYNETYGEKFGDQDEN